jgi:hypothetical protein
MAEVLLVQCSSRGIVGRLVEASPHGTRVGIVHRGAAERSVGRLPCRPNRLLDLIQAVDLDPELDPSAETHSASLPDWLALRDERRSSSRTGLRHPIDRIEFRHGLHHHVGLVHLDAADVDVHFVDDDEQAQRARAC